MIPSHGFNTSDIIIVGNNCLFFSIIFITYLIYLKFIEKRFKGGKEKKSAKIKSAQFR